MFIHGRDKEADQLVRKIEDDVEEATGEKLSDVHETLKVRQRKSIGFGVIIKTAVQRYPKRVVLGLSLFIGQAFLYNAVFFTYALVLTKLLNVPSDLAPWTLVPIAVGNFLGPLVLGRFFDSVGRRTMISGTYIASGVLLAVTAFVFASGALDAFWLTACWMVIFFFASAGASSAYLTVSEIFPMETRAMAIAFFYAVGTGLGGIIGPILFGRFVGEGIQSVAFGYVIGAVLMVAAGVVEIVFGVEAARRSLEDIAAPITAQTEEVPA
jgi:MFS family permease